MHPIIAQISAYAFMAMAEKKDYQVATLWLKDLKEFDIKIDSYTPVLISDLAAIKPEDYDKFFGKIWTKLYTKEKLKQMIPWVYYNYTDVWDSITANQLL